MKSVSFGSFFEGAVSVERGDGWYKPWRLPHDQRLLFPLPDERLLRFAAMSSGVRLRCRTDARQVCLEVAPLTPEEAKTPDRSFDVTIEKYASDQLHHNGEGIEEIAARWMPEVMHQFGLGR